MASTITVAVCMGTRNAFHQLLRRHCRPFSLSSTAFRADQRETSEQNPTLGDKSEKRDDRSDEESTEQEEHDIRQQILHASLQFVHQHGWTQKALAAGAEAEGFPSISQGMFPRGAGELVHFFYAKSNQELASILAQKVIEFGDQKPKSQEFIRDAVEIRLRMILPFIETWPQAMAIQAMPQNAPESLRNLSQLVDDIWFYAGDRSVDFNWYTKRAALAAVYKASEIYMLQDRSEAKADTWLFLERRLENMTTLGKMVRNCSQMSTVMWEGLWGMCIVGRNMLGMNPRNR